MKLTMLLVFSSTFLFFRFSLVEAGPSTTEPPLYFPDKYIWKQMSGQFNQKHEYMTSFKEAFHLCHKWGLYLPIVSSLEDIDQLIKEHLSDNDGHQLEILLGHQYRWDVDWFDFLNESTTPSSSSFINTFAHLQNPSCINCSLFLVLETNECRELRCGPVWQLKMVDVNNIREFSSATKKIYCANRTLPDIVQVHIYPRQNESVVNLPDPHLTDSKPSTMESAVISMVVFLLGTICLFTLGVVFYCFLGWKNKR